MMLFGRVFILNKLYLSKPDSPWDKIIKETYSMMQKKNEKITIEYPVTVDGIKKFETEGHSRTNDQQNAISYHNSIHQLIKIFDEKSKVNTIKEKLNGTKIFPWKTKKENGQGHR